MPSPIRVKRKISLVLNKQRFKKLNVFQTLPQTLPQIPSELDTSIPEPKKKTFLIRKPFQLILRPKRVLFTTQKPNCLSQSINHSYKFFTDLHNLSVQFDETFIRRKSSQFITQKDNISLSQFQFTSQHRCKNNVGRNIEKMKTKVKILTLFKPGRSHVDFDMSLEIEDVPLYVLPHLQITKAKVVRPASLLKRMKMRENMDALNINSSQMENFMKKLTLRDTYISKICEKQDFVKVSQSTNKTKKQKRMPSIMLTTSKMLDTTRLYKNFSSPAKQKINTNVHSTTAFFSKKQLLDTYVSDRQSISYLKSKGLI